VISLIPHRPRARPGLAPICVGGETRGGRRHTILPLEIGFEVLLPIPRSRGGSHRNCPMGIEWGGNLLSSL